MSLRDPGSLSRANGAHSVVDHFWKRLEVNEEEEEEDLHESGRAVKSGVPKTPTYRSTSLIRNNISIGPYTRLMSRALWFYEQGISVVAPSKEAHQSKKVALPQSMW